MKETTKRPMLTEMPEIKADVVPKIINYPKWNLNIILLILFVLFLIFFLYNCKYGMFRSMENENLYPLAAFNS
jgi:hypothetical protein